MPWCQCEIQNRETDTITNYQSPGGNAVSPCAHYLVKTLCQQAGQVRLYHANSPPLTQGMAIVAPPPPFKIRTATAVTNSLESNITSLTTLEPSNQWCSLVQSMTTLLYDSHVSDCGISVFTATHIQFSINSNPVSDHHNMQNNYTVSIWSADPCMWDFKGHPWRQMTARLVHAQAKTCIRKLVDRQTHRKKLRTVYRAKLWSTSKFSFKAE